MSKTKILVVEDGRVTQLRIQKSLKNSGYDITDIVSSGEEAIQKISETVPDLVLMDIMLKGDMDGVEAAKQIHNFCDVPIVYLTAYADENILKRAKITGPYGYIIKPFEERELHSTIEMALYKHKADEQIKTSLKEKEILLKEISHRVKNNMNVIASILKLQSRNIKDEYYLNIFRECQDRIKSMAQIHEELYKSKNLAEISFGNYVRTLTGRLVKSYAIGPDSIQLDVDIDNVFLGVDSAIPCGLIINELFSNSLKYAFPALNMNSEQEVGNSTQREQGKDKGKIFISFHCEDNKYTLIYSDNGIGFPEDLDFQNTDTLGMELVNTLTLQLGGTVELDRSKGTEFRIKFDN